MKKVAIIGAGLQAKRRSAPIAATVPLWSEAAPCAIASVPTPAMSGPTRRRTGGAPIGCRADGHRVRDARRRRRGLGLTISGALIFFSSWLARLIQLPREQAELTRRLLDRTPAPTRRRPQMIRVAD